MIENLKIEFEKLKENYDDFAFLDGEKNILISAPHCVSQTRNGQEKFPEPETAEISLFLNKLGYPSIIKTKNNCDDANSDENSNYKNKILEICQNKKIIFVLDLHQLSKNREIEICIGTGGEIYNNLLNLKHLKNKFVEIFESENFYAKLNEPFGATGENIISGYFSRKGFPAIQLEINSKLLYNVPENEFLKILSCITKLLNLIEKEVQNETINCS